ncbi:hypothetical protein [Actinomadura sp. HBU206391]|uniref:hypothetical protein n=1 Tax=Actinomadura sp. HBU206391 TaxID=2731692 RepID=UPI00164EEBC5|nr:hypothetical protein [Actinomadura sp. HBU206391]MBC6457204.1 hypothetical protein [Actinomadura sp. HBU206391]
MTVSAELAEISQWWRTQWSATRSGPMPAARGPRPFRIAGSANDQTTRDGVDNPYWQFVRQLPSVDAGLDGVAADGFARGLPVGHHLLTMRYSWAIPSPGDIGWLADLLGHRGLVEIGAGSGYWAWQARQAGIDVLAYEPSDPADNGYSDGVEYLATLRGDHTAAGRHPDRAMLLCWPSQGDPWAALALAAYAGDLLVYIGEGPGGRCADDGFFELLGRHWTPAGASPHHVSWSRTRCTMTAYRRTT